MVVGVLVMGKIYVKGEIEMSEEACFTVAKVMYAVSVVYLLPYALLEICRKGRLTLSMLINIMLAVFTPILNTAILSITLISSVDSMLNWAEGVVLRKKRN